MLENFSHIMDEAFVRTKHIHAQVGFEQGPQVPDPRALEWTYALKYFLTWWDAIINYHTKNKSDLVTITTEFGPVPYLHTIPYTNKPVANLFEINSFMKALLKNRYEW